MATVYFDKGNPFSNLNLDSRLFKAIAKLRFVYPTLVQSRCIPNVVEGRDVLVRARTGSGKTLAYALPVLQRLLQLIEDAQSSGSTERGIQVIVLVPTRELCDQVHQQFTSLMYYCDDLTILNLSSKVNQQSTSSLRSLPHIIVSTPTRLLDQLKELGGGFTLGLHTSLKILVLDEADLLLSYGCEEDVKALLEHFPKIHQSLLMSATLSPEIESLKSLVLHNAVTVDPDTEGIGSQKGKTGKGILKELYLKTSQPDKYLIIYALLKLNQIKGKTLFFVNSVDSCYRLKLFLEAFSIPSAILNAELPYNSRHNILLQFNQGLFEYLIATDQSLEFDDEEEDTKKGEEKNSKEKKESTLESSGKKKSNEEEEEDDEEKDEEDDEEEEEDPNWKKKYEMEQKRKQKEEAKALKESLKNNKLQKRKKNEYGVSRGVDFKGVENVVNVDFPRSTKAYIHRVGRTARAGAKGTAISLVRSKDSHFLESLLSYQKEKHGDVLIQELAYDMNAVEAFRYRVEDISRSVTKVAIKEARLKEIRAEIINSKKLSAHFGRNPQEIQLLKHAKVLRPSKVQPHLARVPDYLLMDPLKRQQTDAQSQTEQATPEPEGMSRVSRNLLRKLKGKKRQATEEGGGGVKKIKKIQTDPLKTFILPTDDGEGKAVSVVDSGDVSFGKSTSGRSKWKRVHRKHRGRHIRRKR